MTKKAQRSEEQIKALVIDWASNGMSETATCKQLGIDKRVFRSGPLCDLFWRHRNDYMIRVARRINRLFFEGANCPARLAIWYAENVLAWSPDKEEDVSSLDDITGSVKRMLDSYLSDDENTEPETSPDATPAENEQSAV